MKVIATTLSSFPPSFEGNPWTYGFALFSLTLLSMLSMARVWSLLSDVFKARALARECPMLVRPCNPLPMWSVLTLHETKLMCLYLTIFIGAFPDVLILLLWGEVSPLAMTRLFLVDRVCDGLTLVPFSIAMMIGAWLAQVIPQKLISNNRREELKPPNWQAIMPTAKIASALTVIAIGVTMGKASVG